MPHSNGSLSPDSQQQQISQPRPVPPAGKQHSPTGAAGPWTGSHAALKGDKPALPLTPLTDDELSIPTARDTNPGGSSSSSSDDSSDGVVLINGLAAGAAAAAATAAAANGASKGGPPPREGGLANGKLGSPQAQAQQNGRVKGGPPATFGAQELLSLQAGGASTDAETDALRSTLAQHDLLREQPGAQQPEQPEEQEQPPEQPQQPQQPQQQQPEQLRSPPPSRSPPPQPPSIGPNPEVGNSYAARAAGLASSSSQQRPMPASYSSAVGGGSAARAPASAAEQAASQQRRPQRPYSQAVAGGLGAGSSASSASSTSSASTTSTSSSSAPRPAQQPQQQPQQPQQQPGGGRSSRGAGSPTSPSGGNPWAGAAPGAPPDAPASHHVPSASTDLERLLQQVTPMLRLEGSAQGLEELRLADVWRFYQEPSLYGREVYTLGGTRGPSWSYFVPYLSAVQLFVPTGPKDPGTNRLYISDMEGWPKHMHLQFEYFERELPFNRAPLHDMIEALSGRAPAEGGAGPLLMEQQVAALHPASWFSVAWYPVYRIPDAPLTARFLTFHSFAQVVVNLRAQKDQAPARPISLMPLQVIGLKWQNLQGERWLENLPEAVAGGGAGGARQPTPGHSSGDEVQGGARRGRMQHSNSVLDMAWQAHLSELQATAERLSRGAALRVLGQMGAEPADLRHPDFEFFHTRG